LSIFSGNGDGSEVERDIEVLGVTTEPVADDEYRFEDMVISDVELCLSKISSFNSVLA
jgi:hypothetical protein